MIFAPLHYQAQLPRCYSFVIFLYLTLLVANCTYAFVYVCVCMFPHSIIWFLSLKDETFSSFAIPSLSHLRTHLTTSPLSLPSNICLKATLFNIGLLFSPEDTPILQNSYHFLTHYLNNSLMFIVCAPPVLCKLHENRKFHCCLWLISEHLQKCLAYS